MFQKIRKRILKKRLKNRFYGKISDINKIMIADIYTI